MRIDEEQRFVNARDILVAEPASRDAALRKSRDCEQRQARPANEFTYVQWHSSSENLRERGVPHL